MVGLLRPEVPVMTKLSWQLCPLSASVVAAGPRMVNESKSNRTEQTSAK